MFTTQPLSVSVTGGTVALDAVATNSPTYQWMLNGTAVTGATDSTILITDAASNAGTYTCVATNPDGTATSSSATVSIVATSDPGRLINLSCRAQVDTGGEILIGGFAIGGVGTAGTEPVLIRASGPALAQFEVTGTLPDPKLQLFSGSTVLASNTGWAGNPTITSTAAAVGAFAWTNANSLDSALLESLSGGPYTAQVSGDSGDTGVALMEVYDATPAGKYVAGTSPRLVNLAARVEVGTGAGSAAGFVIRGSSALTVLIRASGPALASFGLTGTLPDPDLTLDPATGAAIATNTAWGGSTEISTAAVSVGAFAWGTASSHDSALLITLPPGAYTANVVGASGDTGVALIEVYEVP